MLKLLDLLPKLKRNQNYLNPRIKFDGKHWYLTVSYEIKLIRTELTDKVIGIDLGVEKLATLSNGRVYKNLNKTHEVKRLKKKLKREQRRLSRKIEKKIDHYIITNAIGKDGKTYQSRKPVFVRCLRDYKNISKQSSKIRLIHKRISDIRNNYLHQVTTEIVKTKPSRIVVENLNVRGMMNNKYLSKSIQEQCFYRFKMYLKYKCDRYRIEFIEADRFYPSSKLCSHCGHKKKDLKLKDRIYKCSECGLEIDRDLNAAINLMNYNV